MEGGMTFDIKRCNFGILIAREPEKKHTPKGVVDWLIEESGFQPSDMCELTKRCVHLLYNFHCNVVQNQLEEGDTDNLPMWISDTQKLETVLHLLKDI